MSIILLKTLVNRHKHLIFAAFISAAIFAVFFPSFYTSNDERNYIQNAYYLIDGGPDQLIRDDVDCPGNGSEAYGFEVPDSALTQKEGCISKYNLGTSIILIPFVAIDWQLSFVATLIFFLISIFFVYKTLIKLNIAKWFIYFYSLYPPFSYYSHKVMSEIFSASLASVLFYLAVNLKENQSKKLSLLLFGIISGFLVLVRYTNATIVIALLVYIFIPKINFKSIAFVILGSIPFILFFFLSNYYFYGGFVKSGYSLAGEEFFWNTNLFLKQLPLYILNLNVMYPFMGILLLIKLFLFKSKNYVLHLLAFILLIINLIIYMGFDGFNFNQGINNFIFGMRFFVPIMPIVLIAYFDLLNSYYQKIKLGNLFLKSIFIAFGIVVLIVCKILIANELDKKVEQYRKESDNLYLNYTIEDRPSLPYNYINDAFKKGKRYVSADTWIPPKLRTY